MTHAAHAEPAPSSNPHASAHATEAHGTDGTEPSPSGFTLWTVVRRNPDRPAPTDAAAVASLADAVDEVEASGVTIRGFYDVSGLRADADIIVWLHGPTAEGLQAAWRMLRRSALLEPLLPTWHAMGVHRDAEFNRSHVPAFLRDVPPKGWLCLYPFVRSYEWYLLPDEDRRRMLAEHGRAGAAFRGVLANTVASFALGDYEWLLPLEADDVTELVDMMRDLRATDARRHVREEVPFYTGRRIPIEDIPEVLR